MKTYLLNIPKELKKFSQELDVKALLCNKTWEVLNDEGNKQVFIFQNDGKLLISTNGDVTNSTWQFITANNSIVITALDQTTMLHPAFIDGVIFAMQKDGTQECLFLIDEQNKDICPNRTLTELNLYFYQEVSKILEIEARQLEQQQREQERKKREEEQKKREEEQKKREEERKKREQEERKKREQERLEKIAIEHRDEIEALVQKRKNIFSFFIAFFSGVLIIFVILAAVYRNNELFYSFLIVIPFALGIDLIFIVSLLDKKWKENAENKIIERYR